MHIIEATFQSLDELPVAALFGATGVYVLWSAKANKKPSYLGEGLLIQRLANEHIERFGTSACGYAAIMEANTDKRRKADAEIVETTLLQIADKIGLFPTHNKAWGKAKGIVKHFSAGHNVIRINVRGFMPLRWQKYIDGRVEVCVRLVGSESHPEIIVEHPWR
jgi:hypothetical protein